MLLSIPKVYIRRVFSNDNTGEQYIYTKMEGLKNRKLYE